ncbi:hypothetical protein NDA13_000729 [Ustilago tritici]|nr:hypothetical protein NDA13_000729 [Ustilago tritici]
MLASTSTLSSTILTTTSNEGLRHLYRTILHQARLLSSTFNDPVILTSHRYLVRCNLSPLLTTRPSHLPSTSSCAYPPSTEAKRILRARTQRRHLADANFGWEHAVYRSLSLAYARSGKLRRDALSDLSPHPSASPSEKKYPKELRKKEFPPLLVGLLTSEASMDGAPVKNASHLTNRPPPPFLPAEDDALVQHFNKASGRRRVSGAKKKYLKSYMRKLKVPLDIVTGDRASEDSLFARLVNKARPMAEEFVNLPTRFHLRDEQKREEREGKDSKPYLNTAYKAVQQYKSKMNAAQHRTKALRTQGWDSNPKDYSQPRRQRRIYARILDDAPLLLLASSTPTKAEEEEKKREKDPLGIRSKLKQATWIMERKKRGKVRVVKSAFGIGPKNHRFETVPFGLFSHPSNEGEGRGLNSIEKRFLEQQGLL